MPVPAAPDDDRRAAERRQRHLRARHDVRHRLRGLVVDDRCAAPAVRDPLGQRHPRRRVRAADEPAHGSPPQRAGPACCALERSRSPDRRTSSVNDVVVPNPNPTPAFFADTPGALQNALSDILSAHRRRTRRRERRPRTRRPARRSSADPNSPTTVGAQYLSSFNPSPGLPLTGDIVRSRDVCTAVAEHLQPGAGVLAGRGRRLRRRTSTRARAIRGRSSPSSPTSPATGPLDSTTTIRPYVTTSVGDGIGQYSATTYAGAASSGDPEPLTRSRSGSRRRARTTRRRRNVPSAPG